jgi:UTP--glucose-1-phosphate uridylyltransferase
MTVLRKAVFPIAGLGTRFLPATKASPKEMLPVVDKPLIQYAVEEAIAAGFTDMIFVTGRTKRAIEDHFDKAYELETELEQKNKLDLLALVRATSPPGISFSYTRQAAALGLGHAVLMAAHLVGDEPFAVVLADDLIDGTPGALQQMVHAFEQHQASILGVQQVPLEHTPMYGIVQSHPIDAANERVHSIVEKPALGTNTSTLAVAGRYILEPHIFELLRTAAPGQGGEIQLTDAIKALLASRPVVAHRYSGRRYDCGSKLGYLTATMELGLQHADVGEQFAQYLAQRKAP